MQQQEEYDQIENEEAIGDRNQASPRKSYCQGREQRIGNEHHHQCAGEHSGEIFEAAGDTKVVADWSNDVIAGEDQKVIEEAQRQRADFLRIDVHDFTQKAREAA